MSDLDSKKRTLDEEKEEPSPKKARLNEENGTVNKSASNDNESEQKNTKENNNNKNNSNTEESNEIDYFTQKWDKLSISPETKKAVDKLGFEFMTEIQAKAIPHVLEGKDIAGAAKTGSGKTLAFVLPCVEILAREKWSRELGTGVIVIAPTRELAIQIKGVAQQIAQFHRNIKVGMVIGGANRSNEAKMLKMGCAIVISTPGRLVDHIENTPFRYDSLRLLVVDEADHILDIGFEHQMQAILRAIPVERQTLLFSATLTNKTKDLVTMAFRRRPVFIRASGAKGGPTADKLTQSYVILPQDKKLAGLLTWLKKHKDLKILIFFSTRTGTIFYEKLFRSIGIRVLALYGAMSQDKRTDTFFKFVEAKSGILLATNVASRGLDFPAVHWVVQFDPPINPKEYIHRVGRSARAGLQGEALSFLQPTELAYLDLLKECNLELEELKIDDIDFEGLQQKINDVVENNFDLKASAVDACKAFVRAYDQRAYTVFSNTGVNRQEAAMSFGLSDFPKMSFSFRSSNYGDRDKDRDGGSRDGFRDGGRGRGRGRGGGGSSSWGGGRGRGGRGRGRDY